ncbi:MAG: hypothetical protein LBV30_00030, partial [Propionibacteriaceae bacterium]|nr:hypothetical protein [Propionibacteriaceae bacterium]
MRLIDAAGDVLLGACCPACGSPALGVCAACRLILSRAAPAVHHRLGLALPIWASLDYQGLVRRLIIAAKEQRRWDGLTTLAWLLAKAAASAADELSLTGPGVLVPVPSAASSVRRRGLDHMAAITRLSASRLNQLGLNCRRGLWLDFAGR